MEKISLDLWGGTHILDKNTLTYYQDRPYGFFSNLTVCWYGIMQFYSRGFLPENISLNLPLYEKDYDCFLDLFKIKKDVVDFDDIDKIELENFLKYTQPSMIGIGHYKKDINFNIFNKILSKYFTFSDETEIIYQNMIKNHNIDFNNTVFIWARKTDKVVEDHGVPSLDDYMNVIKNNNIPSNNIILQTDDLSVLEEFKKTELSFKSLDEIPYSRNNDGFHIGLSNITNEEFISIYGIDKVTYLRRMICLVKIASKSKYSITYPGNLATVIPIFRGNWDNQFSFKNKKELIS